MPKLCDRLNGFHPLPDKLPNLPFDDLVLRNFVLLVVPVGLGVPDDTPEELPIDRADIEPFDELLDNGYDRQMYMSKQKRLSLNPQKSTFK